MHIWSLASIKIGVWGLCVSVGFYPRRLDLLAPGLWRSLSLPEPPDPHPCPAISQTARWHGHLSTTRPPTHGSPNGCASGALPRSGLTTHCSNTCPSNLTAQTTVAEHYTSTCQTIPVGGRAATQVPHAARRPCRHNPAVSSQRPAHCQHQSTGLTKGPPKGDTPCTRPTVGSTSPCSWPAPTACSPRQPLHGNKPPTQGRHGIAW